jgi:hypothetical protein
MIEQRGLAYVGPAYDGDEAAAKCAVVVHS